MFVIASWVYVWPICRVTDNHHRTCDGTLIPKGTRINAGLVALHYDDVLYENTEVFDPFRFANIGEKDEEGEKHQFVTTSPGVLVVLTRRTCMVCPSFIDC